MRPIRFGETGQMYELTTRVIDGHHYLRPEQAVNDVLLGCLGRALHLYPLHIHAFVFMSNHYHMLVTAADAEQLAEFMCHFNGNSSREINRLRGRTGPMWHRRFRHIPVTSEKAAQIGRLRYLLEHGVKERLVSRPEQWPGAASVTAMLKGNSIFGIWRDRTAEYDARRRKSYVEAPGQFETRYEIPIAPLPCWAHCLLVDWQEDVHALVAEITTQAALDSNAELPDGAIADVLGVNGVLAGSPFRRSPPPRRGRAPFVHAATSEFRCEWRDKLRQLRSHYAEASELFRRGDVSATFPKGVFRPCGPFVPLSRRENPLSAAA